MNQTGVNRMAITQVDRAGVAATWYIFATAVLLWPLPSGLTRFIVQDLGDPLLNCWVLGWGADHLLRALRGDLSALSGFWNANIFYPEPLALAYSESLFAQVAQILPIYAVTGDVVLCYNLLFLSTFALSALGAYLFVREITGNAVAAFVAGLIYGFVPYRVSQFGHLQVLSSQWMPFVLFFLRRYFDRRRMSALVAATVALVAQNLSCGYYLVFFTPFVAAYVLYEIVDRGLMGDAQLWLSLVVAGAAAALATGPFILPYLELRWRGLGPRTPGEVDYYSADVYGYLTASKALRVWGGFVRAFSGKPEGALFLGFVPVVLAAVGVLDRAVQMWRRVASTPAPEPLRLWSGRAALAVCAGAALLTAVVLVAGRRIVFIRQLSPILANVTYVVPVACLAGLALVAVSPRARAFVRGVPGSPLLFSVAAAGLAVWLSFGRGIETMGYHVSYDTLYEWLYRYVPGFDGLRVPSRYAMIASLFLAVLAGFGAAVVTRWRRGRAIAFAAGVLVLVEGAAVPVEVHRLAWLRRSAATPTTTAEVRDPARIYRMVGRLPGNAVLTELPFCQLEDEVRYMFYSTGHWRRLTNGYSGSFPATYLQRCEVLRRPTDQPEAAWAALLASGSTHVIVHEWAFPGTTGADVSQWLRRSGAHLVAASESEVVFQIR